MKKYLQTTLQKLDLNFKLKLGLTYCKVITEIIKVYVTEQTNTHTHACRVLSHWAHAGSQESSHNSITKRPINIDRYWPILKNTASHTHIKHTHGGWKGWTDRQRLVPQHEWIITKTAQRTNYGWLFRNQNTHTHTRTDSVSEAAVHHISEISYWDCSSLYAEGSSLTISASQSATSVKN